MSREHAVELALQLMRLGVSKQGVEHLLATVSHDVIERQLEFLPYRKARRPEAFIVQAIRNDFSPPKEFFYASNPPYPTGLDDAMDKNAEPLD